MTRTAKVAVGVLGSIVLVLGGITAYAAIPAADGTITACMTKPGGTIRLIDAEHGATCKKSETKVEWNQAGQPGTDGTDAPDFATQLYRGPGGSGGPVSGGYAWQSFCRLGDKVVGIADMNTNFSPAVLNFGINTAQDGREGYFMLLSGTGVSGFITPLCIDVTP